MRQILKEKGGQCIWSGLLMIVGASTCEVGVVYVGTMVLWREEPVKSPWFSLNHISHLAIVEIRVVRLGSFQNLYLSFAIVEITHGVTANRDDNYGTLTDRIHIN